MKHGNSQTGRIPVLRERLRELQREMSIKEFADKLGLSRQTVGFYLNGDRIPDSETLIQICKSCNVSADWLLGLSGDPSIESYTIDKLGLSIETARNLEYYCSLENPDDFIGGANMILSDPYISPISKAISALAHSVDIEKERMREYILNRFGDTKNSIPGYSFIEEHTRKLTIEIQNEIAKCYPELEGRFFIQSGTNALDARMQDILTLFESAVRRMTGYGDYMLGDIDDFCDSHKG